MDTNVNYQLLCVLLFQQTSVFDGYVPSMNMLVISLLVHAASPKTRVLSSLPWRQGKKITALIRIRILYNLRNFSYDSAPPRYISIKKTTTTHNMFLPVSSNSPLNTIPPLPPAFRETSFLLSLFSLFSFFKCVWITMTLAFHLTAIKDPNLLVLIKVMNHALLK